MIAVALCVLAGVIGAGAGSDGDYFERGRPAARGDGAGDCGGGVSPPPPKLSSRWRCRYPAFQASGPDFPEDAHPANGETFKARTVLSDVRVRSIRATDVEAVVGKPGSLTTSLLGMSFLQHVRLRIEGDQLALYQ
jgi:hypothetical protein